MPAIKDLHIKRILNEISAETGISKTKVYAAFKHMLNWQWKGFHTAAFVQFYWSRCLKFSFFNNKRVPARMHKPGWDDWKNRTKYRGGSSVPFTNYHKDIENFDVTKKQKRLILEVVSYDPKMVHCYLYPNIPKGLRANDNRPGSRSKRFRPYKHTMSCYYKKDIDEWSTAWRLTELVNKSNDYLESLIETLKYIENVQDSDEDYVKNIKQKFEKNSEKDSTNRG